MANNQAVTYKTLSGGHQLTHPSGEGVFVVLLVFTLILLCAPSRTWLIGGVNQERAKQVETQLNWEISTAPKAIKTKRSTRAMMMPYIRAFCWYSRGTLKAPKIMIKNEQVIYAQRPLGEPAGIELTRILASVDGPH